VVSIDNDDTSDLDQLSVAEPPRRRGGEAARGVADVDADGGPGSPIDGPPARITDVRLHAAEIFPICPEWLSTDLTSSARRGTGSQSVA